MQHYASLSAEFLKSLSDNFNIMMKSGRLDKVVKIIQ